MKLVRPVLAAALGTGLALTPLAHAATTTAGKVACNLVTDASQDTFAARSQDGAGAYGPQEDVLDITSMDLASDAKTLTGVVRVVKLATKAGTAPNGTDYRIAFTLPGQDPKAENFVLNARTDSAGVPTFLLVLRTVVGASQSLTAKIADATGTFDTAKNEVRISVPVDAVKSGSASLTPGAKLSFEGLDETAARTVAISPATGVGTATFADVASSDKTYTAGTKSCVTPGK